MDLAVPAFGSKVSSCQSKGWRGQWTNHGPWSNAECRLAESAAPLDTLPSSRWGRGEPKGSRPAWRMRWSQPYRYDSRYRSPGPPHLSPGYGSAAVHAHGTADESLRQSFFERVSRRVMELALRSTSVTVVGGTPPRDVVTWQPPRSSRVPVRHRCACGPASRACGAVFSIVFSGGRGPPVRWDRRTMSHESDTSPDV